LKSHPYLYSDPEIGSFFRSLADVSGKLIGSSLFMTRYLRTRK